MRLQGLAETHFSGVRSFDANAGGYSAIPWVFRTLLATMSPRQWMLLSYLYLRAGPDGLTWMTDAEIGADIGIGAKKLSPHFKALEERGYISTKRLRHRRYVKLVDPMLVAERLLWPDSYLSDAQRQRLAEDLLHIRRFRKRRRETWDESPQEAS